MSLAPGLWRCLDVVQIDRQARCAFHHPLLSTQPRIIRRRTVTTSTSDASSAAPQKRPSTKTLLKQAYADIDSLQYGIGSYVIPEEDKANMKAMSTLQGPKAWTYGEIDFEGVTTLGKCIGAEDDPTARHVFYDLGSGLGRMVFQVFLEWAGVQRCVGVELSSHRHARATRAQRQLATHLQAAAPRQLEFVNANLLSVEMASATIVYLACTCWDADFMAQVMEKLRTLPNLRWVISTESLEAEFGLDSDLQWCPLHSQIKLPMSWDEEWPVYIYKPNDRMD